MCMHYAILFKIANVVNFSLRFDPQDAPLDRGNDSVLTLFNLF